MQANFLNFKLAGSGCSRCQAGWKVFFQAAGDIFLTPGHGVSIGVHGQGDGGMAQAVLDVAGMFSLGEEAGGVIMPQVVKADVGNACGFH